MNIDLGKCYLFTLADGRRIEVRAINIDSDGNPILEWPIGSGTYFPLPRLIGGFTSVEEFECPRAG